MDSSGTDSTPTTELSLDQGLRVWWATTWRYVVITMFVGLAFSLLRGLIGTFLSVEPLDLAQGNQTVATVVATVTSAVVMMFALRQALLADYHAFSLTVLEEGSDEPGRTHRAFGASRMLRVWWAAAWPLHLIGQGVNFVALRFGGDLEAVEAPESMAPPCLVLVLLLAVQFGLSVLCLWRALRKSYQGFRLAALEAWSSQGL